MPPSQTSSTTLTTTVIEMPVENDSLSQPRTSSKSRSGPPKKKHAQSTSAAKRTYMSKALTAVRRKGKFVGLLLGAMLFFSINMSMGYSWEVVPDLPREDDAALIGGEFAAPQKIVMNVEPGAPFVPPRVKVPLEDIENIFDVPDDPHHDDEVPPNNQSKEPQKKRQLGPPELENSGRKPLGDSNWRLRSSWDYPQAQGDLPMKATRPVPSEAALKAAAGKLGKKPLSLKEIHDSFVPEQERTKVFVPVSPQGKLLPSRDIFTSVTSKGSAQGWYFEDDPLKYRVCKFNGVCFNSTHTLIPVADDWEREWLEGILAGCAANRAPVHPACSCFSGARSHIAITQEEARLLKQAAGSHYVLDKFISGKHIGHWVEAVGLLHSVVLNSLSYGIANLDSVAFLKDSVPLTDHESTVLAIATKGLAPSTAFHWKDSLDAEGGTCFEESYSTTLTARVATNTADAASLRRRAFDHMEFDLSRCPPKKTVLLHRSGERRRRTILNEDDLERVLKTFGFVDIERTTISPSNTSFEQALLFNQAGLIIAPHGSELVNGIFSQPTAAMIEVVPTLFNYDFAQLGLDLATPVWFSVGGEVPGVEFPEVADKCNQLFKNCVGEPRCCKNMEKKNPECGKDSKESPSYLDFSKSIKQQDFSADVKAFERVVREMVKKFNDACEGKWPGIRTKMVV